MLLEKQQRRILELEKEVRMLTISASEASALADSLSASLSTARRKAEEADEARTSLLSEAEIRKADVIAQKQAIEDLAKKQKKLEVLQTKIEATFEVGQASLETVKKHSLAVTGELRASTSANRELSRELAVEKEKAEALEIGIADMHKANKALQGDLSVQRCELEKMKLVVESHDDKVRHLEESLKSATDLIRTLRESQELERVESGSVKQATLALQVRNSSLEAQMSQLNQNENSASAAQCDRISSLEIIKRRLELFVDAAREKLGRCVASGTVTEADVVSALTFPDESEGKGKGGEGMTATGSMADPFRVAFAPSEVTTPPTAIAGSKRGRDEPRSSSTSAASASKQAPSAPRKRLRPPYSKASPSSTAEGGCGLCGGESFGLMITCKANGGRCPKKVRSGVRRQQIPGRGNNVLNPPFATRHALVTGTSTRSMHHREGHAPGRVRL